MALNASRDSFVATHHLLLLGSPAQNTTPAVPKRSQLCIIRLMHEVACAQLYDVVTCCLLTSRKDLGPASTTKILGRPGLCPGNVCSDCSAPEVHVAALCCPNLGSCRTWVVGLVEASTRQVDELYQQLQEAALAVAYGHSS